MYASRAGGAVSGHSWWQARAITTGPASCLSHWLLLLLLLTARVLRVNAHLEGSGSNVAGGEARLRQLLRLHSSTVSSW